MTEASWPSPNHGSPARSVTDTEYVRLAPWASDGVFQSASPPVYANSSGMQVYVRANQYGIVRGHAWTSGSAEFNLTIGNNTSGKTRVDTVVLRLDRSTWDVTTAVRQGTPGSGAPTLQRDTGDTGLWEIPLADVTVANGAASIAATNVRIRTLYQSGAIRACAVITDIQSTLAMGDLVYETQTGRWITWTGSTGVPLAPDTGWQAVAAAGNFTAGALTPRVRAVNGVVYLKGDFIVPVFPGGLGDGGSTSSVAQLPTGFAPAETHIWLAPIGQSAGGRMRLDPSGLVTLNAVQFGSLSQGQGVYLDTTYLLG